MNNPFTTLGVLRGANKGEILARVASLMKQQPENLKLIAESQKILFDVKSRAVAESLYCLDLPALLPTDANGAMSKDQTGPLIFDWLDCFQ